MRHKLRGRRLGRNTAHRTALKRNILDALFRHGRIVTTLEKAKEYRPFAEKLITLARTKNLHNIRIVARDIQDRSLLKHLFEEIAPRFNDRSGGYTRILRLPNRRLGDNGKQAIFELVEKPEPLAKED